MVGDISFVQVFHLWKIKSNGPGILHRTWYGRQGALYGV